MITLGLHFGHDANMALVVDGTLQGYYEKERHVRVRHAAGLTSEEITGFLTAYGLSLDRVDCCAITTTQFISIFLWDKDLSISVVGPAKIPVSERQKCTTFENRGSDNYNHFTSWAPAAPEEDYFISDAFPWLSPAHGPTASLEAIAGHAKFIDLRQSQQQEITLTVHGKSPRKAYYLSHHLAHAAYTHAYSPFKAPLIITFDGMASGDFTGGGVYFGSQGATLPAIPHGFWAGSFYDRVAEQIGLGKIGGAGKLMGLAAYGVPAYADADMIGTFIEIRKFSPFTNGAQIADFWLKRALTPIHVTKVTIPAWDGKSAPPEFQANIAASAQAIFSQNVVATVQAAIGFARRTDFHFDGIALSGGCALNCPANALLATHYGPIFVPPAVNDEGLGIGAALFFAEGWKKPALTPAIAYIGNEYTVSKEELAELSAEFTLLAEGPAAIPLLAQEIHNGKIAGFYHGRAEVGPRALGHRSILASPLMAENIERVNRIKSREQWRPLAPITTDKHGEEYFSHLPPDAYFMLLNSRVKTRALPAITHVDGTARVQIATVECGPVYDLLNAFGKLSGYHVLLNTSFNGKLEPILETPRHAINAFRTMPLDLLYMNGMLWAKKPAA